MNTEKLGGDETTYTFDPQRLMEDMVGICMTGILTRIAYQRMAQTTVAHQEVVLRNRRILASRLETLEKFLSHPAEPRLVEDFLELAVEANLKLLSLAEEKNYPRERLNSFANFADIFDNLGEEALNCAVAVRLVGPEGSYEIRSFV